MSEQDAGTTNPTTATPVFQAPETPAAAPSTEAEVRPAADATDESGLDPRVRKLIDDVRGDFKAERAKRQAAEQAVEQVRADFAQQIGKALGLVADEPVDPAALTEQLTATQAQAKQAALELAIFKSTPDADAAKALLDSRSFLAKVADIDPTDTAAIAAAVVEAVEANPALGKRLPAPNPAQGTSANGPSSAGQLSRQDVERLSREGKHGEIDQARQDGRLNELLGIK